VSLTVSVSDEVFGRVPGLRLVIVSARNIASLAHPHLPVSIFWRDAWQKVFASGVRPAEQPNIQAYRSALKTAGVKIQDYPPAVEAIYRRACKSSLPFSVSPIVDFYNACTLNHAMPVAGFDIDRLGTALALTVFGGDETFFGLGREAPETVSTGEIGYRSGGEPLSRHFMWRQSRNAALDDDTVKPAPHY
jgi:DNA/RNA-binding domain of Phe-tRNA-synthetase-like protein